MGGEYKAMRTLYWAPRVCGGALLLFMIWTVVAAAATRINSISTGQEIILLLMPAYLLAGLFAFACRFERLGGVLFVAVAAGIWALPQVVPALHPAHMALSVITGLLFLVGYFAAKGRWDAQNLA